jgi:thiosulfate reductase electron transport protein
MAFSLARKTGRRRHAYSAYLRSGAWAWRRQRWFRDCRSRGTEPACQVCGLTLTSAGTLDLHHTSYNGVKINDAGTYRSEEPDADLLPYCRGHHEALHRILDDRRSDYWGWDRRRATTVITRILARKLHRRTP